MAVEDPVYVEALSAVDAGDMQRARDLLTRLLQRESNRVEYWLLMSSVVETSKERTFCLKEVLRLDPLNIHAKRGMIMMGALPPDDKLAFPARLQKRSWDVTLIKSEYEPKKVGKVWLRLPLYLLGLTVAIVLIVVAVIGITSRPKAVAVVPTRPTYDLRPIALATTAVPQIGGTPYPTLTGQPTAPWQGMLTLTPTPLYFSTPISRIEDYNIALRAYRRGEWDTALLHFNNVIKTEPNALDVYYYLGEINRFQEKYNEAVKYYEKALNVNQDFAPGYLGRGRARLAEGQDSTKNIRGDFLKALEKDPYMGEAYLEIGFLDLDSGDAETALTYLQQADVLLPSSQLVSYGLARGYAQLDETDNALALAEETIRRDPSYLPAYLIQATMLQAKGDLEGSLTALQTLAYFGDPNADVQTMLARVYLEQGNDELAQAALDLSLSLDKRQFDALMMRAELYMKYEEYDKAMKDFTAAYGLDNDSFAASLGRGRVFLMQERYSDAYDQIGNSKRLAQNDSDMAAFYYYRALTLEKINPNSALKDWQSLLELPEGSASQNWLDEAQAAIFARTPSPTVTNTHAPFQTWTRVKTSTATPTPKKSSSPAVTLTRTVTPTPKP